MISLAVFGSTSNLPRRVWQHKSGSVDGFSKKYRVHSLVYYELYEDMYTAICRERQLKRWNRAWKIELIESKNPDWDDLYLRILWLCLPGVLLELAGFA